MLSQTAKFTLYATYSYMCEMQIGLCPRLWNKQKMNSQKEQQAITHTCMEQVELHFIDRDTN